MARHFGVVADCRLVPLRPRHLERFELEHFCARGSWVPGARALKASAWAADARTSFVDLARTATVVERAQLEGFLCWQTGAPLAWCLERLADGRALGYAMSSAGPGRSLVLCVSHEAEKVDFYAYLNPLPPPASVFELATDLEAQARRALGHGLTACAVVEGVLEFVACLEPVTAAGLALGALGLSSTLAHLEPTLSLTSLRSHRELWEQRLSMGLRQPRS